MSMPVDSDHPFPYDQYLVWPCDNLDLDAEDVLERQIRDVVGPDIKVTRETTAATAAKNSPRSVLFWEIEVPSDEHLLQLKKLEGVGKCLQKDGIDEDLNSEDERTIGGDGASA
nr:hypothetical protein B0A51_02703 [Rachicladosporium sp. CCFEE 5018]